MRDDCSNHPSNTPLSPRMWRRHVRNKRDRSDIRYFTASVYEYDDKNERRRSLCTVKSVEFAVARINNYQCSRTDEWHESHECSVTMKCQERLDRRSEVEIF